MKYYIIEGNNVQAGPFEVYELFQHGLNYNSLVWCQGMANWQAASQVPELAAAIAAQSMNSGGNTTLPPTTGTPMPQQQQTSTLPQGGYVNPMPQQQQQPQGGFNTGGPTYQPQNNQRQYQVGTTKTWLVESVVVTLLCAMCCCNVVSLVTGIIAIFKAYNAKKYNEMGNRTAAEQAAQSAKKWLIITVVVAVVWTGIQAYRLYTNPEFLQQIQQT